MTASGDRHVVASSAASFNVSAAYESSCEPATSRGRVIAMPSSTYGLFVEAMVREKQVACVFKRRPRVLSVIILGHTDGKEVALTWQTGGESSKPLPPGGAWRAVTLAEVTDARLLDSKLRRGTRRSGAQHWVADVDLDVNPDSPYHPRRQLEEIRGARDRR
jgi:hypothetical protein